MNFSVSIHSAGEKSSVTKEEAVQIESAFKEGLQHTTERMRLLYFQEELERDLRKEEAIEVIYDETMTVESEFVGKIEADRVILFKSGRLKAEDDSELVPIVTVKNSEITVWFCRWSGIMKE